MKEANEARINSLLACLWQKNLPTLRERLNILDQAARIAATGSLPEASRLEALGIAHKLSGSLGMFGHQQGTEIATNMEKIFRSPNAENLPSLTALATELRETLASFL